jgi:hypothetical protein
VDVPGAPVEPIPANVERRGRLSVRWATLQPSAGRIALVNDVQALSKGRFFEYLSPSSSGSEAIPKDRSGPRFTQLDGTDGRTTRAGDLVEYPLPAIGSSLARVAATSRSRNRMPSATTDSAKDAAS